MRSDSFDEEDIIEHSNKTSTGRISSDKIQLQVGIVKSFERILENLLRNKNVVKKLMLREISELEKILEQSFEGEVEGRTQENSVFRAVSDLLIKCLPHLLPDDWNKKILAHFLQHHS